MQRPAGQNEAQERNAQAVETGTYGLGRVQRCCPDVQGWDLESQGTDGSDLGKGCRCAQGLFLERKMSRCWSPSPGVQPLIPHDI